MSDSSKNNGFVDLRRCLQCAICTGSCPVARVIEGYNPREILLRHLLYGEEPEVIESDMVWNCLTCHTCEERCPHGISVGDLMLHIMNRAAEQGHLPKALRQTLSSIAQTGRAIPVSGRTERLRAGLGLAQLQSGNIERVRELLRRCGIDKMLEDKCE